MSKLNLLPMPRKIRLNRGRFQLKDDIPILVAPGGDEREFDMASDIAACAFERAGVYVPVERMARLDGIRPRILFLVAGRDNTLDRRLAALAKPLDALPEAVRNQAYVLTVTAREVLAVALAPQGLHHAAQTLKQALDDDGTLPAMRIADWPSYPDRGVMLDISRFKVPKMDTLFDLIEKLAALKINTFQLYTEHTFAFRRHPEIGRNCGSMSAEDIMRLDAFCKRRFVRLDANLQSFGHHRSLLSLPRYNALAEKPDAPWTLCPEDPRVYRLLDDLYAECLPAYSSTLFNASCDETYELGKGRSRKRAERIGLGRVYLGHIVKINRMARAYGKRMMIWADIVLKHPDLIPDIPGNVIMLDWGYEAGEPLNGMRKIQAAGLEFWTCPGVSTWSRIFPDIENACRNIADRAAAGAQAGATGLLNTDWGDGGHPQMPSGSWHGYAWGAEQSWTPDSGTGAADFDRRFAWAWFGDTSGQFGTLYRTLARIGRGTWRRGGLNPFFLYWSAFPCPETFQNAPMLTAATPARMKRLAGLVEKGRAQVKRLLQKFPEQADALAEIRFGLEQVAFALDKAALSREIMGKSAAGRSLTAAHRRKARALLRVWQAQAKTFETLWLAKNRRSEIAYRLGLYRKRAADYRRLL